MPNTKHTRRYEGETRPEFDTYTNLMWYTWLLFLLACVPSCTNPYIKAENLIEGCLPPEQRDQMGQFVTNWATLMPAILG